MSIAQQLLEEFDREAVTTRKFLERMPDDKLPWQPHPKSMTAGQLGLHMAVSTGKVAEMAMLDEFQMPGFAQPNPQPKSTQEVLEAFDKSAATVRQLLPKVTDAQMSAMWRMTKDGQEILAIPRYMVYRNILLNHIYHHRGQFGVYLRLVGASVPSAYGPSGDEMPEFLQQK
jgi:uncharacterized damage-inducible protein DinB